MNPSRLDELVSKFQNNSLTAAERSELYVWYNRQAAKDAMPAIDEEDMHLRLERVAKTLPVLQAKSKTIRPFLPWLAAAASLIAVSTLFFYTTRTPVKEISVAIMADTSSTVQLYGEGRESVAINALELTDTLLMGQSKVYKSASGFIVFENIAEATVDTTWHTVRTTQGGGIKLALADGTQVWLNAESEIAFPIGMSTGNRQVRIKGEVYFEVEKRKNPRNSLADNFIVQTDQQQIEVLGTKFNVISYPNDEVLTTSLTEGSIRLQTRNHDQDALRTFLLKPGQQSILNKKTGEVDFKNFATSTSNWRDGYFTFSGESLKQVCQQLERWYPVTFEIDAALPVGEYHGDIAKSYSLNEVLAILTQDKVAYKVVNKNDKMIVLLTKTNHY